MAQADNVLVVFRNWVDESALSASSEATPAERVQEMRPSRVWRATDDQSAWIGGDAGVDVQAEAFAAIAHNFDTGVDLRLRLGIDANLLSSNPVTSEAAATVLDQEFDAWRPVAGLGVDGFGLSLGGYPILSDFADYKPYSALTFASTTFRYWRLDIAHATGNTLGNLEIGRLMLGYALQTEHNIAFDWSSAWADPSEHIETEDSLLIRRARKYRVLRLKWPFLRRSEAFGKMDDFKRIVGRSRDVLVIIYPTSPDPLQYRTTLYGVPIENGETSNPHYDVHATSAAFRELAR